VPILFYDGFGHYFSSTPSGTDEVPRKWTYAYNAGSIRISTATPRRAGDPYLVLADASAIPTLGKKLSSVYDTVSGGFAFHNESPGEGHRGVSLMRRKVAQVTVVVNDDGSVSVVRGTSGGTVLGTSSPGDVPVGEWVFLEFKIYVHDSVGTYEVYKCSGSNCELLLDSASSAGQDTKGASESGVDEMRLTGASLSEGAKFYDDLYIATGQLLGDCRVEQLMPSDAGGSADWMPTPSGSDNHENVDDDQNMDDDATVNASSSVDDLDSFEFPAVASLGGTIHAVALNIAARKEDAGLRMITPKIIVGSIEHDGEETGLTCDYQVHQEIWEGPPDAPSESWDKNTIDGAEFGYELTT